MKVGKYRGSSFGEVLARDLDYTRFLINASGKEDASNALKEFADWAAKRLPGPSETVEHVDLEEDEKGDGILPAGKHKGQSFVYVLAMDPVYCQWILQEGAKNPDSKFARFARWLSRSPAESVQEGGTGSTTQRAAEEGDESIREEDKDDGKDAGELQDKKQEGKTRQRSTARRREDVKQVGKKVKDEGDGEVGTKLQDAKRGGEKTRKTSETTRKKSATQKNAKGGKGGVDAQRLLNLVAPSSGSSKRDKAEELANQMLPMGRHKGTPFEEILEKDRRFCMYVARNGWPPGSKSDEFARWLLQADPSLGHREEVSQ